MTNDLTLPRGSGDSQMRDFQSLNQECPGKTKSVGPTSWLWVMEGGRVTFGLGVVYYDPFWSAGWQRCRLLPTHCCLGSPPHPRSGELSSGGRNTGVCHRCASRAGRSTLALATCTHCVCCRDEVTGLLPLWAFASSTRKGPIRSDILGACFRCWLYSQLIPALPQLPASGHSRMELLKWDRPLIACPGTCDFSTPGSISS